MNQKKIITFIITLVLLSSFGFQASASELCSKNGYTVLTINGILTNKDGAIDNKDKLARKLNTTYNNQPLKIDYVYNASHLAGLGDIAEVLAQGLFNEKSDYDLTEMLNDASQKVTTQKLLLVGHSQGNFYANNFYGKVASQVGGVPSESIGVYGVASPASYVAGGGKYVTSSTDKVIKNIAGSILKVLPPNIDIQLQSGDDANGHDFSGVYLKYQSDRIVSDIKSSLDKLKNNDIQDPQSMCIYPPKLSLVHKIEGAVLAIADPTANVLKGTVVSAYNVDLYLANGTAKAILAMGNALYNLSANAFGGLESANSPVQPALENTVSTISSLNDSPIKNQTPAKIEKPSLIITVNKTEEPEPLKKNEDILSTQVITPTVPTFIPSGGSHGSNNNPTPVEPEPIITSPTPIVPIIIPDTTPPVITLNGDTDEVVTLNSSYTDLGTTATDAIDGDVSVTTSGTVDTSHIGDYIITYTATDVAGNIGTATRNVKVSTYKYIPKNSFGTGNGDEHDWQVWAFNGSNIYDWTDTYVDNYLREQFKIQAYTGGFWCSQCLEMGIFNHDPQKGFERSDLVLAGLDNNPQSSSNGITYDVDIQWDETGYSQTLSHSGIIDYTSHTNVTNMNNDLWVGWNGSLDDFRTFPSSNNWFGVVYASPDGRTGGNGMILQPYPIYVYSAPPRSRDKAILSFNFESLNVIGTVDEANHTISLTVPFGTDVTNLIPTITTSDKSSIVPNSLTVQNFTNPVIYTVTAENTSTQNYTVTVTVAPDPSI